MPIRAPINEFGLIIQSAFPATGASVVPGSNAYGSYTQMIAGSSVTDDVYSILISANTNGVNAVARDTILKIGIDPAGGTAYVDLIPDLLVSSAGGLTGGTGAGGGIAYVFPLSIKAGTSIAAAASVNNATVGTLIAVCRLSCRPTHPEVLRTGTFVRSFGINSATSSGTAITPNAASSKSTYVQLGSAIAAGDILWWWCGGVGISNAAMINSHSWWDWSIGSAAGVNRPIVVDQDHLTNTGEQAAFVSLGAAGVGVGGDLVFARAGSNAAVPGSMSAAAYGLGG